MLLAILDTGLESLWRWSYTPGITVIANSVSPPRATLYFYGPVTHPTTAIINVLILFQNKHVDRHLQSGKWKFSICLWRYHLALKTKNLAKEFNLWLLCNSSVALDPKRSVLFFFFHLLESVKFFMESLSTPFCFVQNYQLEWLKNRTLTVSHFRIKQRGNGSQAWKWKRPCKWSREDRT